MQPPRALDGADVVLWAWSAPDPFFKMPIDDGSSATPIHGLAICRYPGHDACYRFSCSAQWEVENDSPYGTVDAARTAPSGQYDVSRVDWQPWVAA